MSYLTPAQVLMAAHHDALQKAKLGRETGRHGDAAQLEVVALLLRAQMGHEPSLQVQALLIELAQTEPRN